MQFSLFMTSYGLQYNLSKEPKKKKAKHFLWGSFIFQCIFLYWNKSMNILIVVYPLLHQIHHTLQSQAPSIRCALFSDQGNPISTLKDFKTKQHSTWLLNIQTLRTAFLWKVKSWWNQVNKHRRLHQNEESSTPKLNSQSFFYCWF